MRRLWLVFAQTVTIGLALWFIVATLKPDWAPRIGGGAQQVRLNNSTVPMQEAIAPPSPHQGSYREASQRAMPAVVNIFTSKGAKTSRNPLMEDPLLRASSANARASRKKSSPVWVPASSSARKATS